MECNRLKFLIGLSIGMLALENLCFAALTDDLIRRGSNAAVQLVEGNAQGAAYQAVPSTYIPLAHQTSLNAGLGGVNFRQGIAPLNVLNTKYLNFDASYNVGSPLNFNGLTNPSQNVQMSARNPFFSNTTTLTPKLGRKWF